MSAARHGQAILRAALGLMLVAVATGCPPSLPPPEVLGPTLAPEEALRRVVERRERVHGFRAKAAIEVTVDQDSYSSDAALVAMRPASLRFETLSLLGPTLVLAIDGEKLTAYSSIDKQFFHGTVGSESGYTPSLVLPPLPASSLVDALLATPLGTADGLAIHATDDGRAFVVEVPASASVGPRRLTIDPHSGAPLTLDELSPDGQVRYHAAWERADLPVPASVTLEVPGYGFRLKVSVPRADLDPTVPATLFRVSPPAGATIVDLDAAAPSEGP